MAQFAVTAAGAAVGSLFGAPQVGWLVGSFIGSQLFAEKQQVEGPRLGDLQVQASTYGMGIPQVFGSMRLAGNVIWARPLIEKRRKQSAGKGGGQTVVSYEYFATFAVAFARGPVDAIRRVWADGKLLVDLSESAQQGKTYRYGERVYRLHLGTDTQVPDPVIEMHEGAGMRLLTVGSSISPSTSCRSRTSAIASPTSPPKWSRPRARSIRASSSTWRPRASTTGARTSGGSIPSGRSSTTPGAAGCSRSTASRARSSTASTWRAIRPSLRGGSRNGWQGGPGLFGYTIDPVFADLFIAFNGLSRTTFACLDPDTLQIKSWYRIGLFTPGPMLVYAGRYMACKSALAGSLVIIDFGNQVSGPTPAASVDYSSHSTGLAIDPERARLYVLTESATGAEGWVSWVDAAFEKHGS
jgi:hypothetical protein